MSTLIPAQEGVEPLIITDGLINIFNRLGTKNASTGANKFFPDPKLSENLLTNLYASNGLCRRIVNILPEHALRNFITADELLLDELKRLKVKQKLMDACNWSRLYGAAVIVAFVDDGREMDKPLDLNNVKKLVHLRVYDCNRVRCEKEDLSNNYYAEHYGQPEIYTITPIGGESFKVHRSRLHLMEGDTIPDGRKQYNNYWSQSVLQSVYNDLLNLEITKNSAASIITDFVQNTISVENFSGLIGNEKNNVHLLNRMNLLEETKSASNMIYCDAESENYQKLSANVSGFTDIWAKFENQICATTSNMHMVLFGSSPSGLNSNGESEQESWNNKVESYQEDEVDPALTFIISIIEAQKLWDETKRPKNFEWEFPPLKVANEMEVAQINLSVAQMDAIYIDRGAVGASFVYSKRYADGKFTPDIFIPPSELKEQEREMEELKIDEQNQDLALAVNAELIEDSEADSAKEQFRSRAWNFIRSKFKR